MAARSPWIAILLFVCGFSPCAIAQQPGRVTLPFRETMPAKLGDGFTIPEQTLTLTDEKGWLVATLVAAPDELEWKIVLAKITPDVNPVVKIDPKSPFFSVEYGRWFIRESLGRLRVCREPKPFVDDQWRRIGDAPKGKSLSQAGRLFIVEKDRWCWLCTSPKYDTSNIDVLVRFQHSALNKGFGSMAFNDAHFAEVFCGEARCQDEGDLLIASRFPAYAARAVVAAEEAKTKLIGRPMPTIRGKTIGTDADAVRSERLKGKVVLVDFWATWCAPCVKRMPAVAELHKKYRDRGLVVVGVHANQDAENAEEFVMKNAIPFPIVVDDGETEKRFTVSEFPTYFLIGRDGRVKIGHRNMPPTEAEIEAELAKPATSSD